MAVLARRNETLDSELTRTNKCLGRWRSYPGVGNTVGACSGSLQGMILSSTILFSSKWDSSQDLLGWHSHSKETRGKVSHPVRSRKAKSLDLRDFRAIVRDNKTKGCRKDNKKVLGRQKGQVEKRWDGKWETAKYCDDDDMRAMFTAGAYHGSMSVLPCRPMFRECLEPLWPCLFQSWHPGCFQGVYAGARSGLG